jgi:hypothetical protein
MRLEMTSLLKYAIVFLMILSAVIAFSVCAESSFDSCMQACCGGADRSRPLGRIARFLSAGSLFALSIALTLSVRASVRFRSLVASFVPSPDVLRASSLRI